MPYDDKTGKRTPPNGPSNMVECNAVEPRRTPQEKTQQFAEAFGAIQQFSSGAKRGTDVLPLHLISPHALYAMASAFAEGKEKYGEYNNLKGFPYSNLFDHAMDHLLRWWWGDTSEDHLGHALWNIAQLAHQQGQGMLASDLDDRPLTPKLGSPSAWGKGNVEDMLHHLNHVKAITADIVERVREKKNRNSTTGGPTQPTSSTVLAEEPDPRSAIRQAEAHELITEIEHLCRIKIPNFRYISDQDRVYCVAGEYGVEAEAREVTSWDEAQEIIVAAIKKRHGLE